MVPSSKRRGVLASTASRGFRITAGYRQGKYSRTEADGEEAVETTVNVLGPAVGQSIGIF